MSRLPLILMLSASGAARLLVGAVAEGAGATGVTYANGHLGESDLTEALWKGATKDCFLKTIRIGGIETCTIIELPMVCVRMRNNFLTDLIEATGKHSHFAMETTVSKMFLDEWGDSQYAMPTNKKWGQDSDAGDGDSASGRVMGRTLAPPLMGNLLPSLVHGVSFDTLCNPNINFTGYGFFAEGDETQIGYSQWRAIISPYYLNSMTSAMSLYAKGLETSGLCGLDLDYLVCYGGFGTKYPTAADIGAGSPALRLITGAWRANEIQAGATDRYGPYDTSLGPKTHSQFHLSTALVGGTSVDLAPYSPASYMQFLYPGTGNGASPSASPDDDCYVLGESGAGTSPAVFNQTLSETINKTWIEEDSIGFAYWTRWTCCNWCSSANDSGAEHSLPEKGYDAVLTRKQ